MRINSKRKCIIYKCVCVHDIRVTGPKANAKRLKSIARGPKTITKCYNDNLAIATHMGRMASFTEESYGLLDC